MELRHLRYFLAVAEDLNFTRAAARLHVAQPALSSQVKDLEEELQTALFVRGRRGVRLTSAGKVFYRRARTILDAAADAAEEARTAAGLITGTLSLGFPTGLHLNYLAPVIQRFRNQFPKVELTFEHGLPQAQLKAVREEQLDVAFVTLPLPLEGLQHQVIWRVPYEVVLPRRHPLARRRSFVLADLKGQDFVFCTRESLPEFYDEFFRQCANAGFTPRVVKEVGGYPSNMLGLISVGAGLSVLPHFKDVEHFTGIVWRPLEKPKLWTDFGLVWRSQPTRAVEQFAALATAAFPAPEGDRAEV